jgi:DNA-binding beta-propeller fold protein YncE
MGPGESAVIHTLAFDSRGRLFIGDRNNNRIQIFDQDGNFIAQWFQFGRPSGIYIDRSDVIYVADSESRDGPPTEDNLHFRRLAMASTKAHSAAFASGAP